MLIILYLSTQDNANRLSNQEISKVYLFKEGILKIQRDFVLSREGLRERKAIGISKRTIHNFLEKIRMELGETNYQLSWLFVKELQAEGQRPWSIYTALYRLKKFAKFLKGYG